MFDFKFTCHRPGAGTSKMDKIVFIQLCPDGASIKKKMVYASTASAIKASLGTERILQFQVRCGSRRPYELDFVYANFAFQVSDESEIAHKELLSKLTEKYRDN